MFVMSLDTVRCLEEGVLRTVAGRQHRLDLRHRLPAAAGRRDPVHQRLRGAGRRIGVEAFTKRAEELAAKYGERFEPPALLLEKAKNGEKFA